MQQSDKEKRENIDLKNQTEALCLEAEKELSLLDSNTESETKTQVTQIN